MKYFTLYKSRSCTYSAWVRRIECTHSPVFNKIDTQFLSPFLILVREPSSKAISWPKILETTYFCWGFSCCVLKDLSTISKRILRGGSISHWPFGVKQTAWKCYQGFLFLTAAIPLPIEKHPSLFFKTSIKPHGVGSKNLCIDRERGGLCLPDSYSYYIAFNLRYPLK